MKRPFVLADDGHGEGRGVGLGDDRVDDDAVADTADASDVQVAAALKDPQVISVERGRRLHEER